MAPFHCQEMALEILRPVEGQRASGVIFINETQYIGGFSPSEILRVD